MTKAQTLQLKLSECRQKLNELLGRETRSDEQQAELERLTGEVQKLEPEFRAALAAEPDPDEATSELPDPETRERLELRGRARLGSFLMSALQGRLAAGAEAEYLAACAGGDGQIPVELFEAERPEERAAGDTASGPPATGTGATLAPIQPFLFAGSIAPRLGIDMPQVGSGAYSEATITTALTAAAKGKGAAQASSAATITPTTAKPRRITGRLTLQIEDVAEIGQANYEAALRQNLAAVLSDQYDLQCITGDGTAPNVEGLIDQLTNPTDPTAVADFAAFLEAFSDQIDGLWAAMLSDVAIVTNPDAYKLSAKTFRDRVISTAQAAAVSLGDTSFADYATAHTAGWWTNKRMPATASNVARGVVHRRGRAGLRTACHPVWSMLTIDDIYSDSAAGQRHVTMHALVGDKVLLVQPAAYGLVEFKVA